MPSCHNFQGLALRLNAKKCPLPIVNGQHGRECIARDQTLKSSNWFLGHCFEILSASDPATNFVSGWHSALGESAEILSDVRLKCFEIMRRGNETTIRQFGSHM